MTAVEIYTRPLLPLLHRRQGAADAQGRGIHRDRRRGDPEMRARDGRSAPTAARPFRRFSSARPMSAAATSSTRSTAPASSIRCWRGGKGLAAHERRRLDLHGRPGADALRASTPQANLERRAQLIGEAKPRRRRLRADARGDQHDGAQARALLATIVAEETTIRRSRPFASSRASFGSISISARSPSRRRPSGRSTARS